MDLTYHTTFPETLRDEWNALLEESVSHVPFLRYDYLEAWWVHRGGGEWPDAELAVVSARQDGRLIGIAPLFFTTDHNGHSALMLLGSIEISDYLDLIVRPADLTAFLDALLPFLLLPDRPAWQTLDLYNLLDSSPSLAALEAAAQRHGLTYHQEQLQHSPYIPLPGDWEMYLSSIDKKQRHEIRRKMRRAETAEVPARWYIVTDDNTLEAETEAFLNLMQQDEEKATFLIPEMRQEMHEIIRCAFEEDCLLMAFMEVGGQKAAGYLMFDYLNRVWVYNSGFDRRFMEYSPGWVLLGYLLQWSIEHQRTEFDFMRGNEDYKYRFGAVDRFVVRATLTR
ncbi:MAG TPA: GNAT family N-acetyltransferase [Bellilinea sp.]|nr:GNAT family N-acetyltransferase [Bellilinea sp.]